MLTVTQLIKLARTNNLRLGSAAALVLIGDDPGMTCGDLAAATQVTSAACTSVVDTLVARGLLTRTHSTADRRRIILTPTLVGIEELRKAEA